MKRLSFIIMLVLSAITAQAQDLQLDKVHTLLEQGKYLEAAKELRPLADGGNAEAQQLAAWLFFTGKGVKKNDTQGMKYARMALEQGNFEALRLLASYFRQNGQRANAVALVEEVIIPNAEFKKQVFELSNNDEDLEYCINEFVKKQIEGNQNGKFDFVEVAFAKNIQKGEFLMEVMSISNADEFKNKSLPAITSFDDFESQVEKTLGLKQPFGKTEQAIISWELLEGKIIKYNPALALKYATAAAEAESALGKYILENRLVDYIKQQEEKDAREAEEKRKAEEERYYSQTFDTVDEMPRFRGGDDEALMQYIKQRIIYPSKAKRNRIQGSVIVEFIVERDGSTTDVRIAKSVDPELDKEAMRIIRALPKWIPGKQNGRPVRVKKQIPVVFRL